MIINYLKSRLSVLFVLILFSAVFGALCYLYGLSLMGIAYAIMLCLFFVLALASADYYRFCKKHAQLELMLKSLNAASFAFDGRCDIIEENYRQIIIALHNALNELSTETGRRQSEALDFYALWVHQIKTPISAMSLVLQDCKAPEARVLLPELFKIEQYTELVLSYQRLKDIGADLSFADYSLYDIAKQAVKKYAPLFIGKGVSLNLAPFTVSVITDEKWLCFALEQVISNAIKYTPAGGSISIYPESSDVLVIADSGIGIATEDLPRIFEKGFTGYNGRMDKKATGIGLYLTKKALDKLSHRISISSQSGNGTAVRINIARQKLNTE